MTRREYEGDEAGRCGGCGSRDMLTTVASDGVLHGRCCDCGRDQEVETRDWPMSAMCDNCAFRAGSPERGDPYRWAEVAETVKRGVPFHCHKGLSLDLVTGRFAEPDKGARNRAVCAGWFAANAARFKRPEGSR